jgi:hypothetical protein
VSTTSAITTPVAAPISTPLVSVNVKTVALLLGVAFLALLAYYFVGIDEGAMSLSGKSMLLHEFFHDGRHFLGFPCH